MCIRPRSKPCLPAMRGVKEVAVVGFAKSREGEEIAAFVIPSGDVSEADWSRTAAPISPQISGPASLCS